MHISLFYALYPSRYILLAARLSLPLRDLFSIFVHLHSPGLTAANCTYYAAVSDMCIAIKTLLLSQWKYRVVLKIAYSHFSKNKVTV